MSSTDSSAAPPSADNPDATATHEFSTGGSVTGPPDIVAAAARIDLNMAREQRGWVAQLRAAGVKLAHPDDGWVDRQANTVSPCYPQFDDRPAVGDVIALGSVYDHRPTRLVRVISVVRRPSIIGPREVVMYAFEDTSAVVGG